MLFSQHSWFLVEPVVLLAFLPSARFGFAIPIGLEYFKRGSRVIFVVGVFFFITLIAKDRVEIRTLTTTTTILTEDRIMWLGRLNKSFNIFFESNVEWVRCSSCLLSGVVGIKDAFEMCGSPHRVVEKIDTHLITEFILISLESLELTNGLGEIGYP